MISPLQKRLTQFFHFLFDSSEFSAEDALDRHDHNPSIDSCDDRALDSQNRTGSSDHGNDQNSSPTIVELFAADVEEVIPSLAAQWLDAQPDEGSAELELTELAIAAGEPLQYNSIDLSVDQLDALVHLGDGSSIEDVTAQNAAGQGSMAATTAIAHLDWGDALYHQGLTEEAIGQYRRALEIHPTFAEAYHHLAEALVQQGNLDEAAACYRQAIELALETPGSDLEMGSGVEKSEPSIDLAVEQSYEQQMDVAEEEATDDEMPWFEQASFHVQQAVVHCNAGQWGDAITVCRQAIEQLSPETGMAYFVLGRALQGEGELAEAEQAYRTALSIQPRSAEVYARLGSLYAQQQSLEQAVDFYQQAIAIQPDFTGAYWKLAEVWWQLGDRQKAILCRYEAVQLEPNWATAKEHLLLGTMLLEQGQLEQAIDCYQWAIERDTAYGEAYYRLGEALSLQGQWQKALVYLQQAVDCSPHHAQFYAALGQALTVLEQWQEAATAYQQMTELEPESIQGYIHLRDLLVKLEQWEAVLPCYQKLAELQPENATAWHELGDRLNQLEHWIEAVAAYQRAIERNPDFHWSHNNLGDALMHLERWQEATSAYQRAIERNPDFHWSHYNLGEALAKLEDWDGAIRAFRGALEVEPKSPFVHQKLANVLRLRAKADQATALMLYEQAIDRDPDNLQNYHQAIDIQKNNTELYVRLADALSRKGQDHNAQIFYHMAMQASRVSQLGEQDSIEVASSPIENQPDPIVSNDIPFSYHPFTCHILYIETIEEQYLEEYSVTSKEFDSDFYYAQYPDIAEGGLDPILHYITAGWRELRDPSPNFSTQQYLKYNPDVADRGVNPFYHFIVFGRIEGRRSGSFSTYIFQKPHTPKVSVIIPNYNHARYLPERIDSILNQTYQNYELIILDDCSSDDSRSVIERYHRFFPSKIKYFFNEQNSGGVFKQWRKGLSLATGELIWICESDDSCEVEFLEKLVKYFADPSTMIAFGRIQFMNESSIEFSGLDNYRESACTGIWEEVQVATASSWFKGAFGIRNVIANVGGCIFRNQNLPLEMWRIAEEYKACADWFLYAVLSGGGRIAYDPGAKSYFRQHSANTSVTSFTNPKYYDEHFRVAKFLRNYHGLDDSLLLRFYTLLAEHYKHSYKKDTSEGLIELFDLSSLLREKKITKHILIASLGFHLGGGELFPIHLANQLLAMGYLVSFAILDFNQVNENIRNLLDKRIPVYCQDLIEEVGIERFIADANIDLIHSHNPGWEYFFSSIDSIKTPYMVTHHGAYECSPMSGEHLLKFLKLVTHWAYISDKNLAVFDGLPLSSAAFTKLPNAVPINHEPFPFTRSDLDISDDAFIFGIASRAIRAKGWEEAIKALSIVEKLSNRKVVLLLCGEGEERSRLSELYGELSNIKFLGYQKAIHGFYRLCDCAILASRFPGESFPLTLIESIQTNTPVIATNIGEVQNIIKDKDNSSNLAGVLINPEPNDEKFIDGLAAGMLEMLKPESYLKYVETTKKIQSEFQIERVASQYESIYKKMLKV